MKRWVPESNELVVITDVIYIMLINMLVGFHYLLLFWFLFVYTLKFLIHYFQNLSTLRIFFSLPIQP